DELAEVTLEQIHDREGEERRHERGALLEDVAAVEDRADDRGVGGRTADAALLERAHQRRLGVTRRRRRRVALGLERPRLDVVALLQRRQPALGLVAVLRRLLVATLLVGGEEAAEGDDRAGGRELGVLSGARLGAQSHRDGLAARVRHLRGDGALPDQVVQGGLV